MRALILAIFLVGSIVGGARSAWAVDPKLNSSQYVHRRWTVSDGLGSAGVMSLCQTLDGYIWIGTEEGLSRFDGQRFATFSARNTPAFGRASLVWNVTADRDGSLWVATDGGLLHHTRGNDFTRIDGLSSLDVRAVAVDLRGTTWIGTSKGLDAVRDGRVVDMPERRHVMGETVVAIYPDSDGTLWVSGRSGLLAISGDHARRFGTSDGLPEGHVHAIAKDQGGTLWVAVGNVVARREGEHFVHAYGDPARLEHETRALYVDSHGTVWMGRRDGLHAFGPGRASFDRLRPLAGEMVRGVVEDREGNLWVLTYGTGLHMFQDGAFHVLNPEDKDVLTFGVLAARDGSVWMGSLSGSIYRMREGELTRFPPPEGLVNDAVWTFYEDTDGKIWTGSGDVAQLTDRGFVRFPDGSSRAAFVTSIAPSRAGGLWIGRLGNGLARFVDGKVVERFHVSDGLPTEEVTAARESRDGTLWIGTRDGLARRTGQTIERVPLGNELFNATIADFEEDASGALWIAAAGGLARYENGRGVTFPPSAGFPFIANSVALDELGNVWTGTNSGVCRIPKASFDDFVERGTHAPSYRCFDETDGLRNRETAMGGRSVTHYPDGRLGFATAAGLVTVDPSKVTSDGLDPLVVVQEVDADGTSLGVENQHVLAAGTRQLRIDYAALTFVAPARVRYRYRLEGYDRDWIEAADRRSAHYTNLPPGAYRFVVIAENGRGVWSRAGASVRVRQLPHFYQTAAFYLLSAAALGGVIAFVFRWRMRRLKHTAAVLERRVAEQTTELRAALTQLKEKDERFHNDLVQARAFQRAMLPHIDGSDHVHFAALYDPAELVGGDIYDVTELPGGAFRIFLADTTGHGVQASLRTMVLKGEYDRLKLKCSTPARLLHAINGVLVDAADRRMTCTACCIDIVPDESGGARVVYANAAHLEVLKLSRGRANTIYAPGMYLGVTKEAVYADLEDRLDPGDCVLIYSDGAVDETNAAGVMFGPDRLADELNRALAACADRSEALLAVRQAIDVFRASSDASEPLADDLTLVLVHIGSATPAEVDCGDTGKRKAVGSLVT